MGFYFVCSVIQVLEPLHMTPELSPHIEGALHVVMTPLMKKGPEIGAAMLCGSSIEDLESFSLEDPCV